MNAVFTDHNHSLLAEIQIYSMARACGGRFNKI